MISIFSIFSAANFHCTIHLCNFKMRHSPYSFSLTSEMGSDRMEQKEMAEAAEWLR